MTMYLGDIPLGAVIPVPFAAFSSAGASITLTGLAVTDIEVYKGASMTQRASDAGYTLMDTDGIDLDGVTGIHGFSIDTGDNTDAGFFVAGSFYWVVVASVTIDSQTVNFIPVMWRMVAAENTAGTRVVDTVRVAGTAQTAGDLAAMVTAVDDYIDTEVAAIKAKTDNLPTDPADASDIAASFSTVNSTLATIAAYIDTEVAAIKAKTDNLPADPADASDIAASFSSLASSLATLATYVDTEVAAIKAKTDNLPADPADASDVAAAFSSLATSVSAIATDVDSLQSGIIFGAAATGTLSTTQATSNLTGYADDQLIGRVIIWLTGNCEGEATDITDYASASGLLTFTALTTAPGNGDTFKIV